MQPGYSVPQKNLGANVQGRPVYNSANATVGGGGAMPQGQGQGQGQGRPPYNPGPSASAAPGAMPQGNQPVYNPASTVGGVPPGQGRPVPYNPAIATAATMSPGRPVVYNPGTTPGTMQPGRPVAYNPANTGTIPGRGYSSTQPPIQQQQTMQTGFNQNSTIPNQNTISGIQKNMNTSMNMPPIAMMGNAPRGHGPANFPPTDNRIPPQQGPPQQAGFPNQPGSFIPPSSMNALRGPPKTFSPRTIMPPPTSIPPPPSSGVEQNLAQSVDAFSQMSLNGPGGSSVDYPPRGMPQQTRAPVAQNNTMASGAYNQMDAYNRVGGPSAQAQPPALSEQAMASQCKPIYMKPTVSAIPYSADQGSKSQLSFGVTIRPLAPAASKEDEVDLVNFGSAAGVVRCKRCRTYMNPFVQWIDNGRRWRCNVCNSSNDVPSAYFCHLGQDQQRTDRAQRPELCKGSCEIVAPQEYMMRPPQPPVYVFVIDVSVNAIQNGVLQSVVDTLKTVLVELPGAPRTRVGFVTFDSSVHFYNLKSTLKQPQMMVVPDITELFIPIPDDLLVNLSESRDIIDSLLNLLPSLHKNSRNIEVALGPAIRAAFRVMSTIGGKMCVFLSSLPSLGQGALSHRENPRLLGTEKENTLINSVDNFYRQNAIEFCRQQVSVDMFLTPTQYMDIATIGCLTKYSAGQLFYYPGFSCANDGEKLREELRHCLRRETGWEAVLRVRCTQGMRIANYYGNSFLRGPDLLALPNINADASFAIEIVHSDAVLTTNIISIQAALLYTASCGERRIRVHNLAIPVVKMLSDVFRSVDINTLCNLIAKTALETAIKSGFDAARNKLQMQCADIIRAYRLCGAYMSQHVGMNQLNLPESLQLLPLYTMALMKNPAFRGGTDIRPDERTFTIYQINNMFVEQSIIFIYPRLYSLTNLTDNCGLPDSNSSSNDTIVLPPILNLSIERFSSSEAFLLEDGLTIWLWIGRAVESSFLLSVFGVPTLDGMDCSQLNILSDPKDDIGRRVKNIVSFIRKQRLPYMKLCVIKEGEPGENRISWKLVEDRASFNGGSYSYAEFLAMISKQSFAPPAVSK